MLVKQWHHCDNLHATYVPLRYRMSGWHHSNWFVGNHGLLWIWKTTFLSALAWRTERQDLLEAWVEEHVCVRHTRRPSDLSANLLRTHEETYTCLKWCVWWISFIVAVCWLVTLVTKESVTKESVVETQKIVYCNGVVDEPSTSLPGWSPAMLWQCWKLSRISHFVENVMSWALFISLKTKMCELFDNLILMKRGHMISRRSSQVMRRLDFHVLLWPTLLTIHFMCCL